MVMASSCCSTGWAGVCVVLCCTLLASLVLHYVGLVLSCLVLSCLVLFLCCAVLYVSVLSCGVLCLCCLALSCLVLSPYIFEGHLFRFSKGFLVCQEQEYCFRFIKYPYPLTRTLTLILTLAFRT
jgi:hypothetical protein